MSIVGLRMGCRGRRVKEVFEQEIRSAGDVVMLRRPSVAPRAAPWQLPPNAGRRPACDRLNDPHVLLEQASSDLLTS